MGSIVVADILTDSTRFAHTMLAGNGHHASRSDRAPNTSSPTTSSASSRASSARRSTSSRRRSTPIDSQDPRIVTPAPSQPPPQYAPSPGTRTAPMAVPNARSSSPHAQHQSSSIRQPFPTQQHIALQTHAPPLYHQSTPPHSSASNPQQRVMRNPSVPTTPVDHPAPRPALSTIRSGVPHTTRIQVRDLAHIQSFANEHEHSSPSSRHTRGGYDRNEAGPQYDISAMPVENIIEMVAGLLTKITTTNDIQHEHLHRHIPPPEGSSGLSQQTTSVLAFHGKNVPSITIMSYLSRIHKYCPTTYEVFLSLLVYFDRMTERVNSGPMQTLQKQQQQQQQQSQAGDNAPQGTPTQDVDMANAAPSVGESTADGKSTDATSGEPLNVSQFFVVDSFNIHRLVIAGVTCASKFFSDVFYTNSRYAKVGGLPLPELNHLELQFLLLNDFRLSVPVEELEAYGTMLVEFYAREVLAQRQAVHPPPVYAAASLGNPTPP